MILTCGFVGLGSRKIRWTLERLIRTAAFASCRAVERVPNSGSGHENGDDSRTVTSEHKILNASPITAGQRTGNDERTDVSSDGMPLGRRRKVFTRRAFTKNFSQRPDATDSRTA